MPSASPAQAVEKKPTPVIPEFIWMIWSAEQNGYVPANEEHAFLWARTEEEAKQSCDYQNMWEVYDAIPVKVRCTPV